MARPRKPARTSRSSGILAGGNGIAMICGIHVEIVVRKVTGRVRPILFPICDCTDIMSDDRTNHSQIFKVRLIDAIGRKRRNSVFGNSIKPYFL